MVASAHTTNPPAAPVVLGARLAMVPLLQLAAMYDAYVHANDAIVAILNQPRMRDAESPLGTESDRLLGLADEIVEEMRRRVPVTAHAFDVRAAAPRRLRSNTRPIFTRKTPRRRRCWPACARRDCRPSFLRRRRRADYDGSDRPLPRHY